VAEKRAPDAESDTGSKKTAATPPKRLLTASKRLDCADAPTGAEEFCKRLNGFVIPVFIKEKSK